MMSNKSDGFASTVAEWALKTCVRGLKGAVVLNFVERSPKSNASSDRAVLDRLFLTFSLDGERGSRLRLMLMGDGFGLYRVGVQRSMDFGVIFGGALQRSLDFHFRKYPGS